MLYLNTKIGAQESSDPLIPENIDEYKYYYNIAQFKVPVRFIIDEKERIFLNYDRNLLMNQWIISAHCKLTKDIPFFFLIFSVQAW